MVDLLGLVGGRYLHRHTRTVIRIPVHQIDGVLIPAAPVGVLQFQTVDKIHQPCANILTGNMVLQTVDLRLLLHIVGVDAQASADLIQQLIPCGHILTHFLSFSTLYPKLREKYRKNRPAS